MADKLLTINLRKYLVKKPYWKRPLKISGYVRERVAHYTKTPEENVKLTGALNEAMIKSYARSMLPLKLNVKIDNGIATVSPFAQPKKATTTTAAPKATATAATAPKAEAKSAPTASAPAKEKKAAAEKAPKAKKEQPAPSSN